MNEVDSGIISNEEILRQKSYLQHDYGKFSIQSRNLQIIIPTESPKSPLFVSIISSDLSSSDFQHRVAWRIDRGFLLEQGTGLKTTRSIRFISIVIPMQPLQE